MPQADAPSHARASAEDGGFDLETLAEAVRYNRWIYDTLKPPPRTRVLELGCGIGNLTPLFLEDERTVTAIDIDTRMVECHQKNVGARERLTVRAAAIQDLAREEPASFDAVVSSNVLEHIPDGIEADVVRSAFALLKPGAVTAHWVPATPAVYGAIDTRFGHVRRYRRKQLIALFESAGFVVERCRYWNVIGMAGWWWNGRVRKVANIDKNQALLFDRWFVPWVRCIEKVLPLPVGQSLSIIARKPAVKS